MAGGDKQVTGYTSSSISTHPHHHQPVTQFKEKSVQVLTVGNRVKQSLGWIPTDPCQISKENKTILFFRALRTN